MLLHVKNEVQATSNLWSAVHCMLASLHVLLRTTVLVVMCSICATDTNSTTYINSCIHWCAATCKLELNEGERERRRHILSTVSSKHYCDPSVRFCPWPAAYIEQGDDHYLQLVVGRVVDAFDPFRSPLHGAARYVVVVSASYPSHLYRLYA